MACQPIGFEKKAENVMCKHKFFPLFNVEYFPLKQ